MTRILALVFALACFLPTLSQAAVLATDTFTRGDATDLGTNWDEVTVDTSGTGFRITTNTARAEDTANDSSEVNNAVTWPANQYSKVTYGTAGTTAANTGIGPGCRMVTNAQTGYRLVATTQGYQLARRVAGVFTSLASGAGIVVANGSTLQLNCITVGVNMFWQILKDGAIVNSGTDTSPVTSGSAGIAHSSTTTAGVGTFTAWEGGSIAATHGTPMILSRVFDFILEWLEGSSVYAETY